MDNSARYGRPSFPLHRLLLRMAGRLPDELITEARSWLADGRAPQVAQALAFTAVAYRAAVTHDDAELLESVLTAAGADLSATGDLERTNDEPWPPYTMAPVRPEAPDGLVSPCLDLTGRDTDPSLVDAFDVAARDTVVDQSGAVALWRAWRVPARPSAWPPPKRVYVVEADPGRADLPVIADEIRWALEAVGEVNPQVEAYTPDVELPVYQQLARGYGALLWAGRDGGEIDLARVFDVVAPPSFGDRADLAADERDRVLAYLRGGESLLVTDTTTDDVLAPGSDARVPLNVRTDGRWVWADTVTYYLERHGVGPEEKLLAHIRAAGYRAPDVDAVGLHRALVALQRKGGWEPAWLVPAGTAAVGAP